MKKRTLVQKALAAPYVVWAAIFIIIPMFVVAYYAFTDADGNFTFSNIQKVFDPQYEYANVFLRSISYALIATVICLVIAFPLAYIISRTSPRVQQMLILLVMLPMWMNFLLRTYAWLNILRPLGILNTPQAVIIGMVYNFLPYMIMPIYSVMTKLDKTLLEAAEDLGCNRMAVVSKVILPLSKAGIISGITMVFVPSISTFYISMKLGGGKYDLIGDLIDRQFSTANNFPLGSAISLVLMILIFISMTVMNKFTDNEGGDIIV